MAMILKEAQSFPQYLLPHNDGRVGTLYEMCSHNIKCKNPSNFDERNCNLWLPEQ